MVGWCALCCSFQSISCFVDRMKFASTAVSNHTVVEMNHVGFQSIKYHSSTYDNICSTFAPSFGLRPLTTGVTTLPQQPQGYIY